MRWLRLPRGDFGSQNAGILSVTAGRSVRSSLSTKTLVSWYSELADFYVPDTIQPGEHSMGGGTDGSEYEGPASRTSTGTSTTGSGTPTRGTATTTGGMRAIASSPPTLPMFLPHSSCGSFRFKPLLPTADHPTKLVSPFREKRIFFGIQRLQFPRDPQKEFQQIDLAHGCEDRRQLLVPTLVARYEEVFENQYERRVYLVAERIARAFWKIIPVSMPQLVYY